MGSIPYAWGSTIHGRVNFIGKIGSMGAALGCGRGIGASISTTRCTSRSMGGRVVSVAAARADGWVDGVGSVGSMRGSGSRGSGVRASGAGVRASSSSVRAMATSCAMSAGSSGPGCTTVGRVLMEDLLDLGLDAFENHDVGSLGSCLKVGS